MPADQRLSVMAMSTGVIGALIVVVLGAGALTGSAGFGFAMLGTMVLFSNQPNDLR